MNRVHYFYPKKSFEVKFITKATNYIKRHPKHSKYQVRSAIADRIGKNYYRSLPLYKIENIQHSLTSEEEYIVAGNLTIFDLDYSPPMLISKKYFNYTKHFISKRKAYNHYKEMIELIDIEIAEYSFYPQYHIENALIYLIKVQWYGKEKKFATLEKNIWTI